MKKFPILMSVSFLFATGLLAAKAPTKTPELLEKGKTNFVANCVACHGDKGDGNGPTGKLLNPKPRNFAADKFKKGDKVEQIFNTISNGLEGTAMVGYKHLSDQDRWALAYYVRSLKSDSKDDGKGSKSTKKKSDG